jgi:hypothetical protein
MVLHGLPVAPTTEKKAGSVSDLYFMSLNPQAKFVPVDEQTDDDVMHLNRFGEADRLTRQPFDSGTQRQMLALNLLPVAFARLVLIRIEMTGVRSPIVRVITRDPKRLQERFELQKHFIFAASKDVGKDLAAAVINRMPQPPGLFLLLNE